MSTQRNSLQTVKNEDSDVQRERAEASSVTVRFSTQIARFFWCRHYLLSGFSTVFSSLSSYIFMYWCIYLDLFVDFFFISSIDPMRRRRSCRGKSWELIWCRLRVTSPFFLALALLRKAGLDIQVFFFFSLCVVFIFFLRTFIYFWLRCCWFCEGWDLGTCLLLCNQTYFVVLKCKLDCVNCLKCIQGVQTIRELACCTSFMLEEGCVNCPSNICRVC